MTSTTFRKLAPQENLLFPVQLFKKSHSRARNVDPLHLSLWQTTDSYMDSSEKLVGSHQKESNIVAKQPALKMKLSLPMTYTFKETSGEHNQNSMVVLCETLQSWTGFGLIMTSSARSSWDVNPWWPHNEANCQNYAEVTNSLTQHAKLKFPHWVEVVLSELAEL